MMKRSDVERLIVSFFIAVALFAAIAAAVHFLPLGSEPYPDYGGPMYVTFEEELEPPEPEPEPEPEPAVLPETETMEEIQKEQPKEPETAPPREPVREAPPPGAVSEEEPGADADERGATGTESDDTAGEGVPTVEEAETEPLPEQEVPQTAEAPGPGSEETDEVPSPRGEQRDDEESREEEQPGILGDLSDLDQALARADEEADEGTGEAREEGSRNGNPLEYGSPGSPIDIETLTAKRKSIYTPDPEIGAELAQKLPHVVEVVVSFNLLPSGYIKDLKIVRDSGNTEVDRIIQNTIRKWRFEPVSQEVGSVKVLARYRIRVR